MGLPDLTMQDSQIIAGTLRKAGCSHPDASSRLTRNRLTQMQTSINAQALDITLLKRKVISLNWQFMFTRPMLHAPDMSEQRRLLNEGAYVGAAAGT